MDFQLSRLQLFDGGAEVDGGGLEDRTAEIVFDLGSIGREKIEVGLMGDGCFGLGWRKVLGRRGVAEVAAAAEARGDRAIAFACIFLLRERER